MGVSGGKRGWKRSRDGRKGVSHIHGGGRHGQTRSRPTDVLTPVRVTATGEVLSQHPGVEEGREDAARVRSAPVRGKCRLRGLLEVERVSGVHIAPGVLHQSECASTVESVLIWDIDCFKGAFIECVTRLRIPL